LSDRTEAQTRKDLIDPALKRAGWDVSNPDQVGLEIPVDGFSPEGWRALESELRRMAEGGPACDPNASKHVGNHVLYHLNGQCIAVVEPKHE
jgi:type I site-specific restriction endonuclease